MSIRGRKTGSLKSMTRLEAELESKRRAHDEIERIAVFGQDSELKAKTWIQKDINERLRQQKEYLDTSTQTLQGLKKHKKEYFKYLVTIFLHFAAQEEISKKWVILVDYNDIGLVVRVKGTKYTGAFKVSGLPIFDFYACDMLATKLGNTIAKLEGYVRKSDGGVALPDEEDLKTYGVN